MSEEEMRNTIKDQLKQLSKEQLIDALTGICMVNPAFRMTNALSSLQCANIRDAIDGIQQVNESFDPLQRILFKALNGRKNKLLKSFPRF
jgi:hypothetical protein